MIGCAVALALAVGNAEAKAKKASPHHKGKRSTHAHHAVRPHAARPHAFVPDPGMSLSARQNEAIKAYNACVSGGADPLRHAMDLAYARKDTFLLKGTPEQLGSEICLADVIGLSRYKTIDDINKATLSGELVSVDSPLLAFPPELPLDRRFARPWVREYILSVARDLESYLKAEHAAYELPLLRIPSVVRSFDVQNNLVRSGRSPAGCGSLPICSTHTTGSTIDISVRFLSLKEFVWLEHRLREDRKAGKIIMIYEVFGGHFHMFVVPPEYVAWYKGDATAAAPQLAGALTKTPLR